MAHSYAGFSWFVNGRCGAMEDCLGDGKAALQVAPELGPPSAMVTGLHLHDMRQTFACRRHWTGVDIYTVSKWLRHASVVIRERYGHL